MGKIKGAAEKVTRPFRWWSKGHYTAVKDSVGISDHKRLWGHTHESYRRIGRHLEDLKKPRDPYAEDAPNLRDFREVLNHWGITRAQLPYVKRGLRVQIGLFCLGWVLSAAGIFFGMKNGSLFTVYNASLVFVLSSSFIICRAWRLHVLKTENFVLFKDWLRGRQESNLPCKNIE
jgi:hypothetical protein